MDYKDYQTTQLKREQGRKTRRMLLLSLILVLTLPGSIAAATIVWGIHRYTVAEAAANETAVLKSLASIIRAQRIWLYSRGEFGTFNELHDGGLLDNELRYETPIVSGYLIKMKVVPGVANDIPSYTLTADPLDSRGFFSATGYRHFFVSSIDQVIHVNEFGPATKDDPAVDINQERKR